MLTHIHPAHANGLLDEADTPRFPNAEIYVRVREAAFWPDVPADTADSSGAKRYRPTAMLLWGDVVHLAAAQLAHPDVTLTYDIDYQEQGRQTRRSLFERAATERLLIGGAHLDAPGIDHIARSGNGYSYQPTA